VIELPVGRDEHGRVRDPLPVPVAVPVAQADSPPAAEPAAAREPASAPEPAPEPTPEPKPEADPEPAPGTEIEDVAAASSGRPLRILVLDDEPSIRDFLGRVLSRAGYEPILTSTGAAALDAIRDDPPDAILCDHRMAGMSGTEFHEAVSEIDPLLARRFAFMSGDVLNPELRDFAVARGVQLLAKPFDIASVGSLVAALVAARPA
jgi:CheY-like chemotaxis protein